MTRLVVIAAALVAGASLALANRMPAPAPELPPGEAGAAKLTWTATRGSADRDERGRWIIATDAAPGRNSDGALMTTTAVALPYRLSATWRRLGPEAGRSMHVFITGGTLLVKTGAVLLYAFDDASFANQAWTPVPGMLTTQEHAIAVTQTSSQVTVEIDGTVVATYDLHVKLDSAPIGFGMKGAPALRSEILVEHLGVEPLADAP